MPGAKRATADKFISANRACALIDYLFKILTKIYVDTIIQY